MGARLTIGELAERSGAATSALRFYEARGLLSSERTSGGHRVYPRSTLRRVAFVRAAQRCGLTLDEIREALDTLPSARTPTAADWGRLSRAWQSRLDQRIAELQRLRDELGECIGCGCLSLNACSLYNPGDQAAALGSGPRYLWGDRRPQVAR
jgi:MerR family transcriptional regulator, redox-sensitive transcriptional activator SoxR